MHDFSGSSNVETPAWATLSPTPQERPMTKANKQVLLALVILSAAILSLCLI